jgi:hypothetical protein
VLLSKRCRLPSTPPIPKPLNGFTTKPQTSSKSQNRSYFGSFASSGP